MARYTKEQLRSLGLHNSYTIAEAAGNRFWIAYYPREDSMMGQGPRWQVYGINHRNDPDAYWQDNGRKTFDVNGREDKDNKRIAAMVWAKQHYFQTQGYDLREWERDPWGDYHLAGTIAKAVAAKREIAKSPA